MASKAGVTALAALCLISPGCTQTQSPLVITAQVSPQPVHVGPATFRLNIADRAARPISGAHVQLEGHMSHPGMAPVAGEAMQFEAGRYEGVLQFTMAGDWVVLAKVSLPNGQKAESRIDIHGVQAN